MSRPAALPPRSPGRYRDTYSDDVPRSLPSHLRRVDAGGPDADGLGLARAYTGDAHHVEWPVSRDDPPEYVDVPLPTGSRRYRLVRHPRTGAVALDPTGALVFVPAPER